MTEPGHVSGWFIDEAKGEIRFNSGVDKDGIVWSAITVLDRGSAVAELPREVRTAMARMFLKGWLKDRGFEPIIEGGEASFTMRRKRED